MPTHYLAEVYNCNYLYTRALCMWWSMPEKTAHQESRFFTMKGGLVCCDIYMLLPSRGCLS